MADVGMRCRIDSLFVAVLNVTDVENRYDSFSVYTDGLKIGKVNQLSSIENRNKTATMTLLELLDYPALLLTSFLTTTFIRNIQMRGTAQCGNCRTIGRTRTLGGHGGCGGGLMCHNIKFGHILSGNNTL